MTQNWQSTREQKRCDVKTIEQSNGKNSPKILHKLIKQQMKNWKWDLEWPQKFQHTKNQLFLDFAFCCE